MFSSCQTWSLTREAEQKIIHLTREVRKFIGPKRCFWPKQHFSTPLHAYWEISIETRGCNKKYLVDYGGRGGKCVARQVVRG